MAVINLLEFRAKNLKIATYATALGIVWVSLMLIFCRGHFTIDIFGGLLFGHYLWRFADHHVSIIDYHLLKMDHLHRLAHLPRQCWKCQEPINRWLFRPSLEEKKAPEVADKDRYRARKISDHIYEERDYYSRVNLTESTEGRDRILSNESYK